MVTRRVPREQGQKEDKLGVRREPRGADSLAAFATCDRETRFQEKGEPRDMGVLRFERRKLAKDTLSAIWGFCTDKKFLGHDGREYVIARGGQKSETKNVIDMIVKIEGSDKPLAKYALLLIDIS
jgi:hypothetical protein